MLDMLAAACFFVLPLLLLLLVRLWAVLPRRCGAAEAFALSGQDTPSQEALPRCHVLAVLGSGEACTSCVEGGGEGNTRLAGPAAYPDSAHAPWAPLPQEGTRWKCCVCCRPWTDGEVIGEEAQPPLLPAGPRMHALLVSHTRPIYLVTSPTRRPSLSRGRFSPLTYVVSETDKLSAAKAVAREEAVAARGTVRDAPCRAQMAVRSVHRRIHSILTSAPTETALGVQGSQDTTKS